MTITIRPDAGELWTFINDRADRESWVEIDGQRVIIPPGGTVERRLAKGTHEIHVAIGVLLERSA